MTGFVFTFSLLCTAALQADPAILQRPESGILRPFLEAALPSVRLHGTRTRAESRVPPVGIDGRDAPPCGMSLVPGSTLSPEYQLPQRPTRRLRPIRAPTAS